MIKYYSFIAALFILVMVIAGGCDEFIYVSGVLMNRTNYNDNISCNVIIILKNDYDKLIPNFKLSILKAVDSTEIATSKFSVIHQPVTYEFPDEQIIPVKLDDKIVIIADHPAAGTFAKELIITEQSNVPIVVEFSLGNVPDTLYKAPLLQYFKFKSY